MNGLSYSELMHGLKLAEIEVNRKMLADLTVNDAVVLSQLLQMQLKANGKITTDEDWNRIVPSL